MLCVHVYNHAYFLMIFKIYNKSAKISHIHTVFSCARLYSITGLDSHERLQEALPNSIEDIDGSSATDTTSTISSTASSTARLESV